ncbi:MULTISPECIES: hypothetical protein [unclassified Streptomyces]|uniref:hypothetical protein n=1 Tax=unclassified Streptomyces TaxID=2593676 RepID=UPI0011B08D09|nr:hypothetical protein [Streptomyces sp. SM10]
MTTEKAAPSYEVRYGWDLRTTAIVAAAAVFTAGLAALDVSVVLRVLGIALFGGGGLLMAVNALSRKVAFRVDGEGILLGGSPARYAATTAQVPWEDIAAVVLWRQGTAAGMPWVGVARRPGAGPLPGPGQGEAAHAVVGALVPHVPADVTLASRAMTGWRLDRDRLTAAVARFAPGTPVVDAD